MECLIIAFSFTFVKMFLFGKIKLNGSKKIPVIKRTFICMIYSWIVSLVFWLPLFSISNMIASIIVNVIQKVCF